MLKMVPSRRGTRKLVKREMSDRKKQRVVFAVIASSITVALIWFSFSDEAGAPKVPAPAAHDRQGGADTSSPSAGGLDSLDGWIGKQKDAPSRPEASRRLVELGLKEKAKQ
jgi:hypothetical protein